MNDSDYVEELRMEAKDVPDNKDVIKSIKN